MNQAKRNLLAHSVYAMADQCAGMINDVGIRVALRDIKECAAIGAASVIDDRVRLLEQRLNRIIETMKARANEIHRLLEEE